MTIARPSGRLPAQMREVRIERGYTRHAEGSVLVSFGQTRVLCTASVENKVPGFLRGKGEGWVVHYAFFARRGFTAEARAEAGRRGALLVDAEQLDAELS